VRQEEEMEGVIIETIERKQSDYKEEKQTETKKEAVLYILRRLTLVTAVFVSSASARIRAS
jgi:hypothetical protein